MIAVDTECSGLDFKHGARPFFVTVAGEDFSTTQWEWDVDPLTRKPLIFAEDLREIREALKEESVLQNRKFDFHALASIGVDLPWTPGHCTLRAGHLLASSQPHDLTSMVSIYLGHNIKPLEEKLELAVREARKIAKARFPKWRIAKEGDPMMPSVKGKDKAKKAKGVEEGAIWRCDMWLPRAVAKELNFPKPEPECPHRWESNRCTDCKGHFYWVALSDYSNGDSTATLALWQVMEAKIRERGLWEIYLECIKALPSICRMEQAGVTAIKSRAKILREEFRETAAKCHQRCVELSGGTIDKLPVNGRSKALEDVVFGKFGLTHPKRTETGGLAMDKEVLSDWLDQLDPASPAGEFILNLQFYRKRQTALGYIHSYEKFWLPDEDSQWHSGRKENPELPWIPEYFRLYPNYNPTGTVTLRGSMSNPNGQQISKQFMAEMGDLRKGKNLRWMFGPGPGREWVSMDGQNLELRIPAFEADEKDLIYVFNHPDEAPYYGSYHLVVADLLWPKEFAEWGKRFKVEFEDSLYQWVKNGNFALIYGAQRAKADATYHQVGAFEKIQFRFPRIAALSDRMKGHADRLGYVETIPDLGLGQTVGYPLLCQRTAWGKVMPTTPLNYHVQGTACWWMQCGMSSCDAQLEEWRKEEVTDAHIVLQVHDELVFDFPKKKNLGNLPLYRKLKHLMERGGKRINVPTPVSMEHHETSWAEGMAI